MDRFLKWYEKIGLLRAETELRRLGYTTEADKIKKRVQNLR